MPLTETLRRTIQIHNLIPPESVLIVAVSGGADSLALLHSLTQLTTILHFRLYIATFDHRLRGAESAADVQFVQELAYQWQLPITIGQADVAQIAAEGHIGIEAAARQARYTFLAEVAHQLGTEIIATAHHSGDQAETLLMHLIRGAGLNGLRGMAFRSTLPNAPDLTLIRPLLLVSRAEIEAYCAANDLKPRFDSTNADTSYLRNYIRLHTIPQLHELNPQIERTLVQLADTASIEGDYLDQQLQEAIKDHIAISPNRIQLDKGVFRELHTALQRRFIHWSVTQIVGAVNETGYPQIAAAVTQAAHGEVGSIALLAGGLRLRVDYTTVAIESEDAPPPNEGYILLDSNAAIPVNVPGITVFGDCSLEVTEIPIPEFHARLTIPENSHLLLRTRRTDDIFAPLGLKGHTQKIKKWMVDHKIPQALRDRIPLLVVNDEIAAILVGEKWVVSENFAFMNNERRILHFTLK